MKNKKEKTFNPDDLPEKGVFRSKEIYQHKQPPQSGKTIEHPLNNEDEAEKGKEAEKTSKMQGLNEENSAATNGAFEGLEGERDVKPG